MAISPSIAIDFISHSSSSYPPGHLPIHIGIPDHVTPPLLMSLSSLVLGVALYTKHKQISKATTSVLSSKHLSIDSIYSSIILSLENYGLALISKTEKTSMRTHIIWLIGTLGMLPAITLLYLHQNISISSSLPHQPAFLIVLLIIILGTISVARSNSHIMGVLFLSIVGFMIAVFYLLSNAPDVALTQLAVETLILVIFLVIIGKLPAYYGETSPIRVRLDTILSIFIGTVVFFAVIISTSSFAPKDIVAFFSNRASYPIGSTENIIFDYGGGTNIVNVILVDFRALDTLGEISVVALAALSILTLLHSRNQGGVK